MAAAAACSGVWCLWSAKLVALHQRGRGQVGACGTLARAYCRIESSAKGGRVHESSASGAGFGAGAVVGAGGGAGARPLYGTGNGGPLGRAARAGFKIPTPSCEGFIRAPLSSGAGPETRRIVARAGDGQGDENDSMTTTTTNKSSVAEELVEFLNGACTPFHAVRECLFLSQLEFLPPISWTEWPFRFPLSSILLHGFCFACSVLGSLTFWHCLDLLRSRSRAVRRSRWTDSASPHRFQMRRRSG